VWCAVQTVSKIERRAARRPAPARMCRPVIGDGASWWRIFLTLLLGLASGLWSRWAPGRFRWSGSSSATAAANALRTGPADRVRRADRRRPRPAQQALSFDWGIRSLIKQPACPANRCSSSPNVPQAAASQTAWSDRHHGRWWIRLAPPGRLAGGDATTGRIDAALLRRPPGHDRPALALADTGPHLALRGCGHPRHDLDRPAMTRVSQHQG